MLLRFVGELLRLAFSLFGGGARGLSGFVRKSPGLCQCLRRVRDELLGSLLGRLGITLSFVDLVVNFFLDFLSLVFSTRLGGLAFAPHELVGGPLSLGDALFDLPTRLAFRLRHAGAAKLAYLSRAVGEILGLPRGLHRLVLGLPSTLRGVLRTSHPDFD